MSKNVHVAVGVVCRHESNDGKQWQVFLTKRHESVHQGGKWEFPGGKVEADETVAQALSRELKEEIAIDILACQPLIKISHDYGDKHVVLDVFIVEQFIGEPNAQELQQQQGWFNLAALTTLDFPEANKAIVEKLQQHYLKA